MITIKKVLAHGTFDIIHYGHINYLEKAKSYGDYLIVLISSDSLTKKQGKENFFNEKVRIKMISSLKCVDQVILRKKYITPQMIKDLDVDIFVTTKNGFNYDYLKKTCKVIKVNRTNNISTSDIKNYLLNKSNNFN